MAHLPLIWSPHPPQMAEYIEASHVHGTLPPDQCVQSGREYIIQSVSTVAIYVGDMSASVSGVLERQAACAEDMARQITALKLSVDACTASAGMLALSEMVPGEAGRPSLPATVSALKAELLPWHCRPVDSGARAGRGRLDFSRLDGVGTCLAGEEERAADAKWRAGKRKPSVR